MPSSARAAVGSISARANVMIKVRIFIVLFVFINYLFFLLQRAKIRLFSETADKKVPTERKNIAVQIILGLLRDGRSLQVDGKGNGAELF